MRRERDLEQLFEEAKAQFPYPDLEPTSITSGTLERQHERVEYAEEFTFIVGTLLGEPLLAGGWLELLREADGVILITGFFGIARNGDWKNGSILSDTTALHGTYNVEEKTWKLWIGTY